jgi:hypothetical protein
MDSAWSPLSRSAPTCPGDDIENEWTTAAVRLRCCCSPVSRAACSVVRRSHSLLSGTPCGQARVSLRRGLCVKNFPLSTKQRKIDKLRHGMHFSSSCCLHRILDLNDEEIARIPPSDQLSSSLKVLGIISRWRKRDQKAAARREMKSAFPNFHSAIRRFFRSHTHKLTHWWNLMNLANFHVVLQWNLSLHLDFNVLHLT